MPIRDKIRDFVKCIRECEDAWVMAVGKCTMDTVGLSHLLAATA
jgi:hypothetical protein